ncbi:hypothetical protein ACVRXQ_09155 [Streptococcus panodentis]|uniref:Uncharacterized protein n=1 Tax=Streptococcus panodentis TaxID=1581472 RepID=A0ABS5AWP1_9STRE|nr:hypothetical protein [Streptococcus panodentis]MBP2620993.1 hypothetical protein [Streptococcus panodentis]
MYTYTDKELNSLNQYPNVYSVDPDYAKRNGYSVITSSPNPNPSPNDLKETDKIKIGEQEFQVVATKNDEETGFQGLAVAPIVNGQPDYKNVAVIAAGTDPDSPVNKQGPFSRDFYSAIIARQTYLSPQYKVADQFVKEIMDDPRYEVSQLSGYSQGSYMLKVGAKYHIPTTTFNAWFKYGALTLEEKAFIESNPSMFIDYRRKNDDVVIGNDFNHPEWYDSPIDITNSMPSTIHWIDGSSHKIEEWEFDPVTGQLVDGKGGKPLVSGVYKAYANSLRGFSHYKELKQKWSAKGISGTEQIYLDAAQGQILSSSMASAAQIGADEVTALTQEANEEIEALWSKIDFSSYTELSAEEVEGIFASQGVTREQYVDGFKAEIAHAAAQMTDSAAAFARLDHQLQAAIEKVLATDAQLAGEFQQWKAKM